MLSWKARLYKAIEEQRNRDAEHPLRNKVAEAVRGLDAVSTVSILTMIGLPPTTGNARRISSTMRELGIRSDQKPEVTAWRPNR
jgi:hypothetical protein